MVEQIDEFVKKASFLYHNTLTIYRKNFRNEVRLYKLDEDTYDLSDEDELTNALCACTGYDLAYSIGWEEYLAEQERKR